MRVLLLSDTFSEHTEKWALGLAAEGIEIGLFSFNKGSYSWYNNKANITLLYESDKPLNPDNNFSKLSYLKYVKKLKAAIQLFQPDVLHAHYATSYGLIGALSGFHPFVISAWGTDVMKFPQKNFINKAVLSNNLKQADLICATSNTIKEYLKQVTSKEVSVIPFGVDVETFSKKEVNTIFDKNDFVFGSIKGLEEIYNIDVMIKAFKNLKQKFPDRKIKLLIIGVGTQDKNLRDLTSELNISNDVIFTGRVPFEEIANYFNMLDVLVNISNYESFGVSVIEAMACQKPVIATNTGGLKEIIENEEFGALVEVGNVEQTALAMEKYMLNDELRLSTGVKARQKVVEKYNWKNNLQQMIAEYVKLISDKK